MFSVTDIYPNAGFIFNTGEQSIPEQEEHAGYARIESGKSPDRVINNSEVMRTWGIIVGAIVLLMFIGWIK